MNAALEGVSGQQHSPTALYPRDKTRYPFYSTLGGPQGRSGCAENLVPTGIRSRTFHPVVSRYTNWATGPTFEWHYIYKPLTLIGYPLCVCACVCVCVCVHVRVKQVFVASFEVTSRQAECYLIMLRGMTAQTAYERKLFVSICF